MKKLKKAIVLLVIMGMVYLNLEIVSRALRGDLAKEGFNDVTWISLAGWTSLWLFFIGGFTGLFIGSLNGKRNVPVWIQCLIGMIGIYAIEFVTGLICNIWLKLNLWSYHGWPLNVMGQITFTYAPVWFFIVPFVMWIDDLARYLLFMEKKPDTLLGYYMKLFTLR